MRAAFGQKKLLVVISCMDLTKGLGCTPAWWQLLKALWRAGVDLICTPYFGAPVASPWWTTEPNPCSWEADFFAASRQVLRSLLRSSADAPGSGRGLSGFAIRAAVAARTRPRWREHLRGILERESSISAVLILSVPPNHLQGIPTLLRDRYDVPVWFYDGDAPASLPEYGGFASGFRIYDDADLSEYTGVICNSEGVSDQLGELGADSVHTLHWGADPELFFRFPVQEDIDVGFYGIGESYREEWVKAMIGEPSRHFPESRFAAFGSGFSPGNLGDAKRLPFFPFHRLSAEMSRFRISLNITRRPHASVFASSSARLFEMAVLGGCVVSNPLNGIERWFEPGEEISIVHNANEATETYRSLLADPQSRAEMGKRARERVLDEHTYIHRAKQLLRILSITSR